LVPANRQSEWNSNERGQKKTPSDAEERSHHIFKQ
jgi:hypothetical protein